MWHVFYVPIVLLSIVGLTHQVVSLMRPQWTWLPPAARLMTTVLSLLLLNFIINAASATPGGEWHPFIVVADSAAHAAASSAQKLAQLNRVSALVNVSILLTLVVTWLGLCIAGIVQTWQLMRHFCKRTAEARNPAMLRMLF
jgi:hypothetical protein